jgi:uncharacterized protein GlcG (DUF336 family)
MKAVIALLLIGLVTLRADGTVNVNFARMLEGFGGHEDGDHDGGEMEDEGDCGFITHASLRNALRWATCHVDDDATYDPSTNYDACSKTTGFPGNSNGGFNLNMWGTVVGRSGRVCAVAYTGEMWDSQWPGSRVISAQKASTANSFNLRELALSTSNIYSLVQPGMPLYGLQHSNPTNPEAAYAGEAMNYGTPMDPMVGRRIGGVNVFGGGLGLFVTGTDLPMVKGGIGVSGDSACADHNVAWRVRDALMLNYHPTDDNANYPANSGDDLPGFGHPQCGGTEHTISANLPASRWTN